MKEPKIRFKGFNGEWKNSPLKDFFTKVTKKNTKLECTAVFTNSAEYGIIDQRDYFDFDVANSNNIGGYFIVNPDDFVYNPRVSVTAPVGPISRNRLEYAGVMSPLYLVFKIDGINKDYLCHYYKTNKWHRFMKLSGNCGARFDRLSISDDVFVQMPLIHPTDAKEQMRISVFLDTLDAQISASTSRLASLKQMKAASLQAMFPQEGETVPKVRFKGFKGGWKKVKLGEIGSWSKGKLLSKDNISETGKFKCIHYGELFTMYDEIIYQVFSKTDLNNGCLSQIGDILFPDSDVTPTGLARCSSIMETGVMLGGGILILRPLPQYYSPFISLSVNNEKQQIISRITGTTVRHINATSLSEIEIVCTENIAEQQSIASFFTSLDRQIALHTQRLEKLKQIKAACLDKMFV